MIGSEIVAAADLLVETLTPHLDADWSVPVPGLDFTVASVLAHVVSCAAYYPFDLMGGPTETKTIVIDPRTDTPHDDMLRAVRTSATVLAFTVDSASPGTRGWHGFGLADPAGFAAMAIDELLVHGDDAARGLGTTLTAPHPLALRVLARLYPQHEVGGDDPWQVLRWANGRTDLDGRERQENWRWHAAPLTEGETQ